MLIEKHNRQDALRQKEGLQFESENMLELLELLCAEPRQTTLPEKAERLVRRYINCRKGTLFTVNLLLQHIERTWEIISSDEGDRTNNITEPRPYMRARLGLGQSLEGWAGWKRQQSITSSYFDSTRWIIKQ